MEQSENHQTLRRRAKKPFNVDSLVKDVTQSSRGEAIGIKSVDI